MYGKGLIAKPIKQLRSQGITVSGPRYFIENSSISVFRVKIAELDIYSIPLVIWQRLTAVHFCSSPEGYSTFSN